MFLDIALLNLHYSKITYLCLEECEQREAPQYGFYIGPQRKWCPGQRAQFACNETFQMRGEEYSRCRPDGSWEHEVPSCFSKITIEKQTN